MEVTDKDLELIITKQELGSLETNALTIKEKVKELLPNYDVKNYSIDNIEKAKEDKALLNKTSKVLNDKRIELEKQFMQPFENFKGIIKETTDLIKEASSKIDEIVKSVEDTEKEKKKKEIQEIFDKEVLELKPLVKLEMLFDNRWLNKTFKINEIEDSIKSKLNKIRDDLISISELHSKYEIELKNEYLNSFDLGMIIRKNNELLQKEELLKKQDQESQIVKEKQRETIMQDMSNTVVENKITDKELTYILKITGTTSQMKALRNFLEVNKMNFEKLEM